MFKYIRKRASELLHTQLNADEGQSSSKSSNDEELAYNQQYGDTPLWVRGNKRDGYFITVGLHRLTEPTQTPGDQLVWLSAIPVATWNLIFGLITVATQGVAEEIIREGMTAYKKEPNTLQTN